jgi:2,3-bisphosphoglycerate-dependent phosphoglycerate mutase
VFTKTLSKMSLLVLKRHGQSVYNVENRFTGNVDVALTPLGEQEAHIAGKKIIGITFNIAYTSVLKRAKETLRIVLEEIHQTKISTIENVVFNERIYGRLQGTNKTETAQKYGADQVEIWRRSYRAAPPQGESLEAVVNRLIPYFASEVEPKLKADQRILIVAHGNSLRALMMHVENIDESAIAKVNIPTGIPRVYTFDKTLKIIDVHYL